MHEKLYMALWMGIAIAAIQQLTAINVVMFYANDVFAAQGSIAGTLSFLITLLNFVATLVSPLLITSNYAMNILLLQ